MSERGHFTAETILLLSVLYGHFANDNFVHFISTLFQNNKNHHIKFSHPAAQIHFSVPCKQRQNINKTGKHMVTKKSAFIIMRQCV